jgi:hypothetical protein
MEYIFVTGSHVLNLLLTEYRVFGLVRVKPTAMKLVLSASLLSTLD